MHQRHGVTSAEMVYIPSQCDVSALFCHATVYNLFSFENFSNSFDKNTVNSPFLLSGITISSVEHLKYLKCMCCDMPKGKNNHKVSEYDQEIPQSHTADQPTALSRRATEHLHKQYTCYTPIPHRPRIARIATN